MVAEENSSGNGDSRRSDDTQPSPATRKRLQKAFEAGNLQMRQENHDYATELFTQCVACDPGNAVYIQSFLANLKQKYKNNKKGSGLAFLRTAGLRSMVKKAQVQKDWANVVKSGLEVLKSNPWDLGTLKTMAAACEEMGHGESQLHYLKMAQDHSPRDPEINKLCAKALHARTV